MNFEQPPQQPEASQEQKEKLAKFEAELQENIDSIAGFTEAEFVEQNAEMFGEGDEGEEIARQMYHDMEFPLRGFDSWDEDMSGEMLKKFHEKVLQGYTLAESFTNADGAQVDVLKTKDNNMQVLRIKEETGHVEWILKPIEGNINKE